MAPATGLEPVTYWLTANRSTTELRRNTKGIIPFCPAPGQDESSLAGLEELQTLF